MPRGPLQATRRLEGIRPKTLRYLLTRSPLILLHESCASAKRPPSLALLLLLALPTRAGVVINEIFYHAPDNLEDLEWIELHNPDGQPVDISGWRFTQGNEFRFPEKSQLPPGGYLVLCKDQKLFKGFYDARVDGEIKGSLRDRGDIVALANAAGVPVDRVTYTDQDPWPSSADGISSSLGRITPNAPGDRLENWSASPLPEDSDRPTGTPGAGNASYSATLPPIISHLKAQPPYPIPGQPTQVEALVEDREGVARVELLYRVAKPGFVGDEKSVPMSSTDGGHYAAKIPGMEGSQLVRIRVRAVNNRKAERIHPSPNALRPALSIYVQKAPELSTMAQAEIVTPDAREFASMERLRRRSLQPGMGPFADPERQQLQGALNVGLNLPEAWFQWTVVQTAGPETYRRLRTVFKTLNAEAETVLEEALAAKDPAAQLKTLPARIQTFRKSFAERVTAVLPPDLAPKFEAWHRAQGERPANSPEGFFRRLMDLEGAWTSRPS